jgi:hypothetical protein
MPDPTNPSQDLNPIHRPVSPLKERVSHGSQDGESHDLPLAPRWHKLFTRLLVLIPLLRLAVLALIWRTATAKWFFAQASELAVLAESIRAGHGMASPWAGSFGSALNGGLTGPTAFLTPGYPALIAAVFALFGPYTLHAAIAITVLQALFASATGILLLFLARRLFGIRVAVLAGFGWCLFPTLLFLPTFFWETSLSTLFLVALLDLALRAADRNDYPAWLALGLTSAAALAVNASLLTVIASAFAWTAWRLAWTSHGFAWTKRWTDSTAKPRPNLGPALAGTTLFLLLSLLWPLRNLHQMHAFIPLRSNLGYELWQGNRPGADGFFHVQIHPNTSPAELSRWQQLGELGYMQEKSTLAKATIAAHPARFARLTLKRILCFWSGVNLITNPIVVLEVVLTTLLGLGGAVVLIRRRSPVAPLLLLPLLLYPVPYYLTHPDFRFRLVLEPILLLLSALALVPGDRENLSTPSIG